MATPNSIPFSVKKQFVSTSSSVRSKSASLLLSGQWQDMPARECLTERGKASPLEALATNAAQLPKLCCHHQADFGHYQALLERHMHSLNI